MIKYNLEKCKKRKVEIAYAYEKEIHRNGISMISKNKQYFTEEKEKENLKSL